MLKYDYINKCIETCQFMSKKSYGSPLIIDIDVQLNPIYQKKKKLSRQGEFLFHMNDPVKYEMYKGLDNDVQKHLHKLHDFSS